MATSHNKNNKLLMPQKLKPADHQQVSDVKEETRARHSKRAENIPVVAESVDENPGLSIPRRSLELGIPQTSLHRILHKDLGLKGYKVQLTQKLKSADHQQRRVSADWAVEMLSLADVITIGHRDLVI